METIQAEQFPNDFELGVKILIAEAEVKNPVKKQQTKERLYTRGTKL